MISDAEAKLAALRAECDEVLRDVHPAARAAVTVSISALDLLTILDWFGRSIAASDVKPPTN